MAIKSHKVIWSQSLKYCRIYKISTLALCSSHTLNWHFSKPSAEDLPSLNNYCKQGCEMRTECFRLQEQLSTLLGQLRNQQWPRASFWQTRGRKALGCGFKGAAGKELSSGGLDSNQKQGFISFHLFSSFVFPRIQGTEEAIVCLLCHIEWSCPFVEKSYTNICWQMYSKAYTSPYRLVLEVTKRGPSSISRTQVLNK